MCPTVSDKEKSFIILTHVGGLKLFSLTLKTKQNKLECFSPAIFFRFV
jgi:hypothetical protein